MKSIHRRSIIIVLIALFAMALMPQEVFAADRAISLESATSEMQGQTTGPAALVKTVVNLLCYVAFLAGFWYGLLAVLEYIKTNEWNRVQNKFVGVCLLVAFTGVFYWIWNKADTSMTDTNPTATSHFEQSPSKAGRIC